MTTQLPFDGGPSPVPPDEPAIGHQVLVKDSFFGATAGTISATRKRHGVTEYFIVWRNRKGKVVASTFAPREMLEYAEG